MDFDEILGLEDIDADEMVLVVGGANQTFWAVQRGGGNGDLVLYNVALENQGLAQAYLNMLEGVGLTQVTLEVSGG